MQSLMIRERTADRTADPATHRRATRAPDRNDAGQRSARSGRRLSLGTVFGGGAMIALVVVATVDAGIGA